MQKTAFTIAVLVAVSTVVSLCSNGGTQRRGSGDTESLRLSADVAWDNGVRFTMRWDDARKKMLFDCQKVDAEAVDSFRPRICFGSPRAEYDFDAGNIGIPGDPPDLTRHDNRIHYGMEWAHAETEAASSRTDPFVVTQDMILWGAHNAEGWSRGQLR